jgi:hypothetical protein
MAKTMQCGPLTRSFNVTRADAVEGDEMRIQVEFSSEEPVSRSFGLEVLDHSPKSVRLARLNDGAPFLLDHRSGDSDAQIGVVEAATVENGRGVAEIRFSRSARAQEILTDIRDGIRRKISVGYSIHQFDVSRGKGGDPDTYRATDWEPFEVSLVPVPADNSVGVRGNELFLARSASHTNEVRIMEELEERAEHEDAALDMVEADETETKAEDEKRSVSPNTMQTNQSPAIDADAIRRAASEEADRRDEIRAIANHHKIEEREMKRAISENLSPDAFRAIALRELEKRNPAMQSIRENETAKPDKGSRAHTLDTWARSAVQVLGDRASNIVIPDYSRAGDFQREYVGSNGRRFHRSLAGAPTLVDIAALDAGIGYPIIDETTAHAPEVAQFPIEVITGATIELSVRQDLPTVGFRNANKGRTPVKGEHVTRIFQTQVIEELMQVDIQGVLNASKDPARVLAAEAAAVTAATLQHIGVQTWYAGTTYGGADASAPPGVLAQSETGADHVVDATGSTALTSVWIVELGTEGLHHIYGNDTTLNIGANWMEETVEDSDGKKLRALTNYLSGRVATALKNKNKAVRIKKLGTDSGKGLTDLLLSNALEKVMNLGINPNAIFMNPRSLTQLKNSRTATTTTGRDAEMPTDYEGIPIYWTRNIKNDEGAI